MFDCRRHGMLWTQATNFVQFEVRRGEKDAAFLSQQPLVNSLSYNLINLQYISEATAL